MENINGESKIRKIFFNEVSIAIGIIVATAAVLSIFFKIEMDVALIKQNHSAHIEAIQKNIEDLQKKDVDLQTQAIELMKAVNNYNLTLTEIKTLLKEHLKR